MSIEQVQPQLPPYDRSKTLVKAAWGWLMGLVAVVVEALLTAMATPETVMQVLTAQSWRAAVVPLVVAVAAGLRNWHKHRGGGRALAVLALAIGMPIILGHQSAAAEAHGQASPAVAGDPWTDATGAARGEWYELLDGEPPKGCVTPCPVVACPRTCPPDGENWEIRVTYKAGVTGPATAGGCFGALSQVVCYQLTHVAQKGVTETLSAGDPRCAPGLDICHRVIHPSEILETYGVRSQ